MKIKIKQVDAFTNQVFGGNPAGVVTCADSLTNAEMQQIAKEMNLSETAFVSQSDQADFKVQFFTPRFEVNLCGHATIGTFSTLYEEGRLDAKKSVFYQETKAGVLPVEVTEQNGKKVFMMTQATPRFEAVEINKRLAADMLGLSVDDLLDTPIQKVSTGIWWLVYGVKSLDKLSNAKPNLALVEEISKKHHLIGITPFCLETFEKENSYHMRAIAPIVGVAEDPVCGTGNGCVASYIVHHNLIEQQNVITLRGEEGMEVNRPGCVYVNIHKKGSEISTVKVGGQAITVLEGEIRYK
ncbi:MAG TPA: PhzF family phenazine biosynthesis protein [Patescibacteria group bacterium]|nr:PhzF family phenazine biosynthesis protein [Patescibacteria group bacterium]